ncbi:MAG: hypothetical protein JST35_07620 [Armatimonadetes bacterium]|nr:hypothetical protein [Armatimonadota bacterium]
MTKPTFLGGAVLLTLLCLGYAAGCDSRDATEQVSDKKWSEVANNASSEWITDFGDPRITAVKVGPKLFVPRSFPFVLASGESGESLEAWMDGSFPLPFAGHAFTFGVKDIDKESGQFVMMIYNRDFGNAELKYMKLQSRPSNYLFQSMRLEGKTVQVQFERQDKLGTATNTYPVKLPDEFDGLNLDLGASSSPAPTSNAPANQLPFPPDRKGF